ncbi:MAG: hypothetical protein D6741_02605 [Planctomycetota bacterium]|nr:MAG: hypothetical protein D6741_02605 [Planctomycetota bacterium]
MAKRGTKPTQHDAGVVNVNVIAAPADEIAEVVDADRITAHLVRAAEAVFFDVCYHHLHSDTPPAAQARQFLIGIGCRLEVVRRLPLGLYPPRDELVHQWRSQGIRREIVEQARLAGDDRLAGMLVWPVVDAAGDLVTIYAQDPIPQHPRRLVRDPWRTRVPAWGIDHARASGIKTWIAVERFLDALVLWSNGVGPTIVFEDPFDQIELDRWNALFSLPLESLTLLPFGYRDEAALARLRKQLRACGVEVPLWTIPGRRLGANAGAWLQRTDDVEPSVWIEEHRVPLTTPERVRLTMAVDVPTKSRTTAAETSAKTTDESPPARKKRRSRKARKQTPHAGGDTTPVPLKLTGPTGESECRMHQCPITDCFCFD